MIHSFLLTTVALLLLACAAQPAAAQTLLRVATPGALTGALPIYLGAKRGVFQRYGLTVEVIATRNEQMNMQALMSDSVQFLTSSSTGLFYLGKQGLDAVGIASWNNASPYPVMAQVLKIDDRDSLEYSYRIMKADARPDLFPTAEATVNVLKTMVYEDPAFGQIPPYKFFDLSLVQELKAESK